MLSMGERDAGRLPHPMRTLHPQPCPAGRAFRHRFRLQATIDPDQLRGLQIAFGSARIGLSFFKVSAGLSGVQSMSSRLDDAR